MKSLLESADGSMATVATRRENNDVPRTAKIDLTPTGLLMEGHYTQNPRCSVIGFDDVAPSALYTPSLTTVRQPLESMGASAVGIVVEGINGVLEKRDVAADHRKLAPELVVRELTRSLL
jgi:hypothetical protein